MKTKSAFLFLIALSFSASAQKISAEKVPQKVKAMFNARFPDAEKVSWEMENKKHYEANFTSKGIAQSSTFDENGKWEETGIEIKFPDLPKEVQQTVNKQFAGWKIGEICKVDNAMYGLVFEIEATKGKMEYDLVISKKGEILSKENANDDDNKD